MQFIGRRGKPSKTISDLGTDFVRESLQSTLLHETKKGSKNIWFKEELDGSSTHMHIQPTHTTHFGGVWKRLVRICMKAIYEVLGNKSVSEDLHSTMMCIVEQTLNGRSLTPVNLDVRDLEELTLNHFLLGNKNFCLPYQPCAEVFAHHRKFILQIQG